MRRVRDYRSLLSSCFRPIESNVRNMTPPGVPVERPLDAELGPPDSGWGVCLDPRLCNPCVRLAPPQFSLPHLHDGRVWVLTVQNSVPVLEKASARHSPMLF